MAGILLIAALCASPAYLLELPDEAAYYQVAREDHSRPDFTAVTKYLAPAIDDDTLLATVFQNVNLYQFHITFMATEFPDYFPGITASEYHAIVEVRATRRYFAGALYRIERLGGEIVYGFDLYTDPSSTAELPLPAEVDRLYRALRTACTAGQIVYAPTRAEAILQARTWEDTPFPIYLPDGVIIGDFTAYVTGVAYGRVSILTPAQLASREATGTLSWQDVIFVTTAPGDLLQPVAAVITGTPQTELSHLSLRLSQRRTPNAYDARGSEKLAAFRDQLVRIEVAASGVTAALVADVAEAEEWWATHRLRLPRIPAYDLAETTLKPLSEIASDPNAAAKYGAKARGMALLRQALPDDTVDGFAIPFAWYERYMQENAIVDPDSGELRPYADYITALQADPRFLSDPAFRADRLDDFADELDDEGFVPQEYVDALAARIEATWGATTFEVRFRSSSNLEDIVPFNGAGLYESTSACVADTYDEDTIGPSLCDATQDNERTIQRALRRVWSSLWLPRAYNERDFWQVPDDIAKMGILVTPAFSDEAANGVILTGNPSLPGDNRYVVNALPGELDVVDPPEGVLPEKLILTVQDGVVTQIDRARASTEMPPGQWILSDGEARRLGALAAIAAAKIGPVFSDASGDILLDMEFKVTAAKDRAVVLKQARPFLRERKDDPEPLAIVIPPGTRVCGVFQEGRTLPEEYAVKSTATFIAGRLELPARAGTYNADLLSEILVGPEATPAVPRAGGVFTCESTVAGTRTYYTYKYGQPFTANGNELQVNLEYLSFYRDTNGEEKDEIVFDEPYLCYQFFMHGFLGDPVDPDTIGYKSYTYESLPLFELEVTAKTGETASLAIRFEPPMAGSGPANLVQAEVSFDGVTRRVADYWHLVYSADHHNWNERFWVFLDPPVGDVHVVELYEGFPYENPPVPGSFRLLDASLTPVRTLAIAAWEKKRVADPGTPEFRRGDANDDGKLDIADAIFTLTHLFAHGPAPSCKDAGDANDDGKLDIADAIAILSHLFAEAGPLPPPFDECGTDPTVDALECAGSSSCR